MKKTCRIPKSKHKKRGKEIYPPQPLPHLQPAPHPQFPPQQDIFSRKGKKQSFFEKTEKDEGSNQTNRIE